MNWDRIRVCKCGWALPYVKDSDYDCVQYYIYCPMCATVLKTQDYFVEEMHKEV